ncbi:hypothetical protein ACFLWS_08670 [Chloroflexota bacterium]
MVAIITAWGAMQGLIRAAKALSDEMRLIILKVLLGRERCVGEVMPVPDISQVRASILRQGT